MNPKKRISAKDALLHKYFEADPKMCEPKEYILILLVFPKLKESPMSISRK